MVDYAVVAGEICERWCKLTVEGQELWNHLVADVMRSLAPAMLDASPDVSILNWTSAATDREIMTAIEVGVPREKIIDAVSKYLLLCALGGMRLHDGWLTPDIDPI